MAAKLAANALIDLQSVKDELGITDTSVDNILTGRVNRVSKIVEEYCQRQFGFGFVSENLPISVLRPARIQVKESCPLWLVGSITEDIVAQPTLVDPVNYYIENSAAGFIYRDMRWKTTAIRRPDIVQDFEPGTEQETLNVQYLGGYLMQTQLDTLAGYPGAASSVALGTLIVLTGSVWLCVKAGVTAGVQPVNPTTKSVLGQQGIVQGTAVTDGTVQWVFMGTQGADGTAQEGTAATLPEDLKSAVLDTIVYNYRNRGMDTSVKSESISGLASVSYGDRGLFPPTAQMIIDSYRRLVIA